MTLWQPWISALKMPFGGGWKNFFQFFSKIGLRKVPIFVLYVGVGGNIVYIGVRWFEVRFAHLVFALLIPLPLLSLVKSLEVTWVYLVYHWYLWILFFTIGDHYNNHVSIKISTGIQVRHYNGIPLQC